MQYVKLWITRLQLGHLYLINVVSVEMMVRKNKKLTKNTTHTHTHTYTNRTGHHVCIKKTLSKTVTVIRPKVWDTCTIFYVSVNNTKIAITTWSINGHHIYSFRDNAMTPLKIYHTDNRGVMETTKNCKTSHRYHW